jgi:hypothetical protein
MQRLVPFLLLGLAACGDPPVAPPTFAAGPAADTVIVPVRYISDAVPRADGSWVVLGTEEFEVLVVDFEAGSVTPHPGMTRAEIPGATVLLAAGDTLWVGDWGLRRMTAWLPDGRRVDAVPTPEQLRGAFPRARDAAGQWYFELSAPPGRDGRGVLDSGVVVRADSYLSRFDTVAQITPPESAEVDRGNGPRMELLVLAGRDRWGVLPDGTVWIARVQQNKLDVYPPGGAAAKRGRPMADPILPITETDRQLYGLRFPEEQRGNLANVRFAFVKPAFERAFAEPSGRVWLFKSAIALDSIRSFQVADTAGWQFSVSVPSYGTGIGVSTDAILMAEEFPGGTRLLRFARPAESAAPN